jgi:hypothetical protein
MKAERTYRFPNASIKVYADRTCREFPLWCPMISVPRPRAYAAKALRLLRAHSSNHRNIPPANPTR